MSENKTHQPSPQLLRPEDGLRLNGLVVASEVREVTWEEKRYRQLKATVICNNQTLYFTAKDTEEPLPDVKAFSRISVRVEYARTEKGVITVGGKVDLAAA